jgi:hypothetical protein
VAKRFRYSRGGISKILIKARRGGAVKLQRLSSNANERSPVVETRVVQSSEPPGGVGEVPTATVSPAVANAIFAATGKRIRKLPVKGLDAVR